MFKSAIVSAVLGAAALAGGQYATTGAVPFTPPAASAPATAAQLPTMIAVAPVGTCGPQTAPQPVAEPVAAAASSAGRVNLNTATDAELDTLPDIGKARIGHITHARPIRSIDELAGPGMPASVIAMLKARATV